MPAITAENRDFWQDLANRLDADRPSAGRRVTVMLGRKNKGRTGIVLRHERSKYGQAYRYGSDASDHMRDMAGRYGWRVLIKTGDGTTFWTEADYCLVQGRRPVGEFQRFGKFEAAPEEV